MKHFIVLTFGRLVTYFWHKFHNLRSLYLKSKIDHGLEFYLIKPNILDFHDKFIVGDRVFINTGLNALIYAPIIIGNDVMLGPNVSILTSGHDPELSGNESRESLCRGSIHIGSGSWIGANSVILKDVVIGENCVIGAGSVVTKSIPPNTVAAGVPCRVIRAK